MKYLIGCNYWASNAGTDMWREWDESAVIDDLEILSSNGIEVIRIFPNWRDFQPVVPVLEGQSRLYKYMMEGEKEPENPYWLDPVVLERFSRFCDLCDEYNIKIIVGLVTGWMSGRMYVPSALYGKNLLTDPTAILFEQRLIRGIVTMFCDKKAIFAWDLGNEVYALAEAENEYETANWTAIMTANIRACDNTRPVLSGCDNAAKHAHEYKWTIDAEAEFCDMLVRHPHPFWKKYIWHDYLAGYRAMINATAQGKYFMDLGNKPCLIEEITTTGPMNCSDELAADFARVNILSTWANGMEGFLWWCANEQTHLKSIPYTTNTVEVEQGMTYADRTPKPVLKEFKKMQEVLSGFNFKLSKAEEDAVLIVCGTDDCWARAYSTYAIAKQAGLNVHFAAGEKKLPDSDTYILPSLKGFYVMPREIYLDLQERVKNGATLYISNNTGIIPEFSELTGMKVMDSCEAEERVTVKTDKYEVSFKRDRCYNIAPVTAEVLACDSLGIPAITVNNFGKGKVYYVNFPLEINAMEEHNSFDGDRYKIYREIFKDKLQSIDIKAENPFVNITRHRDIDGSTICVAVNYSKETQKIELILKDGLKVDEVYYGKIDEVAPFDACVFRVK